MSDLVERRIPLQTRWGVFSKKGALTFAIGMTRDHAIRVWLEPGDEFKLPGSTDNSRWERYEAQGYFVAEFQAAALSPKQEDAAR